MTLWGAGQWFLQVSVLLVLVTILLSVALGADSDEVRGDGPDIDPDVVNDLGAVSRMVDLDVPSGMHVYHQAYVADAEAVSTDTVQDWTAVEVQADTYPPRSVWNTDFEEDSILFSDSAELDFSGFDAGEYYIFLWGCQTTSAGAAQVPGDCTWLEPYRVEVGGVEFPAPEWPGDAAQWVNIDASAEDGPDLKLEDYRNYGRIDGSFTFEPSSDVIYYEKARLVRLEDPVWEWMAQWEEPLQFLGWEESLEVDDSVSPGEVWANIDAEASILFDGRATIDSTVQYPGTYVMFLWGCDRDVTPSDETCGWRKPIVFEIGQVEQDAFNIYFVDDTEESSDDTAVQAEQYMQALHERTPFGECPERIESEVVHNPSDEFTVSDMGVEGAAVAFPEADLVVVIHDRSYRETVASQQGIHVIRISQEFPGGVGAAFTHELGHIFGLCDEYDKSVYDKQDTLFTDGCGNPWPSEYGRYPVQTPESQGQQDSGDSGEDGYCSKLPVIDGGTPDATCGKDLDRDPETEEVSIMGGSGAWKWSMDEETGEMNVIGMHVDQPRFSDTGYDHFKTLLNERGFTCNP